ncbi:MoaD/ThiS family protein [Metallumcola ferriviriculae]|uniref:MoaD/ThiS family protein n=1 Tax=Metallumcola ferriviriculae TaxID=3039180 RepID=A0AAU0UN02_9FIRM|nr:MoaD/ThiS family protein [Desulfitibacteraceae bacterium MK1]
MKLEVRVFANLRDQFPKESKGVLTVDLPVDSTVAELIEKLDITRDLPLIIMVNGRRQFEETTLKDGDRVGIFPPVGGG